MSPLFIMVVAVLLAAIGLLSLNMVVTGCAFVLVVMGLVESRKDWWWL